MTNYRTSFIVNNQGTENKLQHLCLVEHTCPNIWDKIVSKDAMLIFDRLEEE